MQTPVNPFKQALADKRAQIGLWLGLANGYTAEICAGAGFDWLLVDGEHSPNDLQTMLHQAQAIAGYPGSHAVARVPMGHGEVGQTLIKQYLDIGYTSLLVPMVDTPEQAAAIVRASRYPGAGLRGLGGARASRWGRYPRYAHEANEQVCLLMQVESRTALDNIEAIAAIDGVDGVFVGPADLAASLGHTGNAGHPEVRAAVDDAIRRIVRTGKAAGILTVDDTLAPHYLALGATFVAVGVDTYLLARATSALAAKFKAQPAGSAP
ncbi:aldolase/citrate lyase family protein [Ramlibacter rhizophilus]|uniref:2-dehydro-3-deoxyglucarate aldolase n=1 Tax=Ramlibacter rhizophilus TaxID=1781167 RepID=A0A4Z0BFD9_9BURK|nr:aldolase/citrate lyase family protein [Ramlibacter rhizophilus]TFY98046.1 2-dehydro-3-deoxyglucarate aldolase [Ramlibacter rhizophilus]